MRKRVSAVVVLLLLAGMASPHVGAQTSEEDSDSSVVTADLSLEGSRSITLVAPVTLDPGASTAITDALATNGYKSVVTELTKTGTNSWILNGKLCGPVDPSSPATSSPDCDDTDGTARANKLFATDGTTELSGGNITVDGRSTSATFGLGLLAGVPTDPSGAVTLGSGDIELVTVTEDATKLYNGVYTSTGSMSLDLSDVNSAGPFHGFWVVTILV